MYWETFITARFRSRVRNISIIQCYAPTEQASNTEKDDFYNQLSTIYNKTSHGSIVMVMDDLNAKIWQDNYILKHVMVTTTAKGLLISAVPIT